MDCKFSPTVHHNKRSNNRFSCRPLDDAVSKWQFKLRAADSMNETVTETLDFSVQQHKSYRSVNHEISVGVKLHDKYSSNVDWQIKLIDGIVQSLGDASSASVLVREIRHNAQEATFIYSNDTLPKNRCPEGKLDELLRVRYSYIISFSNRNVFVAS